MARPVMASLVIPFVGDLRPPIPRIVVLRWPGFPVGLWARAKPENIVVEVSVDVNIGSFSTPI
jgi:hypothetical protein